jgi:hypothetical protein
MNVRIPFLAVVLAALTALLLSGCKSDKGEPVEHLALKELPFAADRITVESFFKKSGWQKLEQYDDRIVFFFPAAVPEELRKLPVMGEEGQAPEPYTIQVFFNHEGRAAIMILHRFDTADRMESFFKAISEDYGLEGLQFSEVTETSGLGNRITESKGAIDTGDMLFLVLRSKMLPVEEKLKNGMNDEIEIRIFPKKLNDGITVDAILH